MSTKAYTADEIRTTFKKQKYKYIGLFDANGKKIVAFNNSKVTPTQQLDKVLLRMESPQLMNGVYLVKGKNAVQTNIAADEYPMLKTDGVAGPALADPAPAPGPVLPKMPAPSPQILTYESALQLQTDILRLEGEKQRLQDRVDELEERCEELEAELQEKMADEKPSQFDSIKTFLSDTLTMAMPVVDKILEQKDRRLAIQERKLDMIRQRRPAPAAAAQQQQQQPQDMGAKFIYDYDANNPEDPVTPHLVNIYNTCSGLDDFRNQIQEIRLQLLDEEGNEDLEVVNLQEMFDEYVKNYGQQ